MMNCIQPYVMDYNGNGILFVLRGRMWIFRSDIGLEIVRGKNSVVRK